MRINSPVPKVPLIDVDPDKVKLILIDSTNPPRRIVVIA